jgi:hypothetical protein
MLRKDYMTIFNFSDGGKPLSLLRNFLLIIVACNGILNLFYYSGNWSGDPEIHIIFAKNLLEGNFLQFNSGEYSSGETSILYMLLVSVFVSLLSPGLVPFAMKAVGLISLFIIIYLISKRLNNVYDKLVFTFATLSIPSLSFQAWLGMENMVFAVLFSLIFFSIVRQEYRSLHHTKASCFLAGASIILFFLRPEAIFLIFSGFIYNLLLRRYGAAFIFLLSVAVIFFLINTFELLLGAPLHGAGQLRSLFSKNEAYHLMIGTLDIAINPKPAYYFIAASPFIAALCFALVFDHDRRKYNVKRFLFCVLMLSIPWFLHLFSILPNTHYSRYQIYFLVTSVMLSVSFYNLASIKGYQKHAVQIAILFTSISVFIWENTSRNIWFTNTLTTSRISQIYSSQTTESKDAKSAELCDAFKACNSIEPPITVALQEVQLRLRLDDRYKVYSLDGIVDYNLGNFLDARNCVNHLDYLKFRKVRVLLEFQDYSPKGTNCGITLQDIEQRLQYSETIRVDDIIFHAFEWEGHTRAWLEYM